MRSRCGSYQSRARSRSGGPFRIVGELPTVSTKAFQSSPARGGAACSQSAAIGSAASAMRSSTRCAEAGPTPGSSCSSRKPATRSRGFSTKRSSASMSLTCAASRNFSPPNFTNGMLRRVSSTSSGPLWLRGAEQHRLLLQARAGLAVVQDALDDVARLVGFVADGDELRLRGRRRARSRGSW